MASRESGLRFSFEWSAAKARLNHEKHGASFEEAVEAFRDPLSRTIPDPDHSNGEERCLLLGSSIRGRLLVVAHSERGDRLRIISAKLASKREKQRHEEG